MKRNLLKLEFLVGFFVAAPTWEHKAGRKQLRKTQSPLGFTLHKRFIDSPVTRSHLRQKPFHFQQTFLYFHHPIAYVRGGAAFPQALELHNPLTELPVPFIQADFPIKEVPFVLTELWSPIMGFPSGWGINISLTQTTTVQSPINIFQCTFSCCFSRRRGLRPCSKSPSSCWRVLSSAQGSWHRNPSSSLFDQRTPSPAFAQCLPKQMIYKHK